MSLRKDAVELSKVLNQIVASGSGSRSAYAAELARGIAENVAQYDGAIFDTGSRVEASDALAELQGESYDENCSTGENKLKALPI